jgi:hypothetical protein
MKQMKILKSCSRIPLLQLMDCLKWSLVIDKHFLCPDSLLPIDVRFLFDTSLSEYMLLNASRQLQIISMPRNVRLVDLACSLGHIQPFTLHPCLWAHHPHRVLNRFIETKGATRHPRRCNATNGNGKEEECSGMNTHSARVYNTCTAFEQLAWAAA